MNRYTLRNRIVPLLISLLLTILAIWFSLTPQHKIATWRSELNYVSYDLTLKTLNIKPKKPESPITIVNIDEKSLTQFGRWPWPRTLIAKLVKKLNDAGVITIAFDIVFADDERNIVKHIKDDLKKQDLAHPTTLKQLSHIEKAYEGDEVLAAALSKGSAILGMILHNQDGKSKGALPRPLMVLDDDAIKDLTMLALNNYTGNKSVIQKAVKNAGFLTTIPDHDGVIRKSPLLIRLGKDVYMSLGLAAAKHYLLEHSFTLETVRQGNATIIEHILLGNQALPTNPRGELLIPYVGPAKTFPYVSAADVLNEKFPQDALKNRIVFIGTTALGLHDSRATPIGSVFPGVEIHANIANAIISGHFIHMPDWAEFYVIVVVGLLAAAVFPFIGASLITLLSFGIPLGLFFINTWLFEVYDLIIPMTIPIALIVILGLFNTAYGFLFEKRYRRLMKNMFGQYVPTQHVEEMSQHPSDYSMHGESRYMTVLFADIRNFTTIAESLTAEQTRELLNKFFTPMTKIIFDHGGTIDKYVGDMIMAFWGAPLKDTQHATHAIESAIKMLKKSEKMREAIVKAGLPEIHIGIGINSGLMNVGDMGSEFRRAYTVLGDSVNLASRLEGLTKYYGVNIVVGEESQRDQPGYVFRRLDRVKVKGKKEAVTIYEVLGKQGEVSDNVLNQLKHHRAFMDAYYAQQWDAAESELVTLKKMDPHSKIYTEYQTRLRYLHANPPGSEWDGVFEHHSK